MKSNHKEYKKHPCISYFSAYLIIIFLSLFNPEIIKADSVVPLSVALTVRDEAAITRVTEPVTSGVPIPEEAGILSIQTLGIFDSSNLELPAQFRVLARWGGAPDDASKPIKWLLVDFQASVSANSNKVYYLRNDGSGTATGSNLAGLAGSTVTVNTGNLQFTIDKNNFNIFDDAWVDLNGDKSYTSDEKIISSSSDNGGIILDTDGIEGNTASNDMFQTSLSSPIEFEIEENGPLKTVISVKGRYASSEGIEHMKYATRIYAYKDKSYVKVRHSYANGLVLGDWRQSTNDPSDDETTDSVSIDYQLNLDANKNYILEKDKGNFETGTLNSGDTVYVQQDDTNTIPDLTYTTNIKGQQSSTTGKAEGYGDLSDSSKGLTVSQRYFWQKYPKRMTLDGNGKINLGLVPIIDTIGEAMGVGNEIMFYFHGSDKSQISDLVYGFNKNPLFAAASNTWYTDSGALGVLDPEPSSKYPKYDTLIASNYDNSIYNRERLKHYGATNFGGHTIHSLSSTPDNNVDSYAWATNYYDGIYQMFHQFGRTADLKYYVMGLEYAQHFIETDCFNIYPGYVGYSTSGDKSGVYGISPTYNSEHRRNTNFEVNFGNGLFYYYYLSGDERVLEIALRGANTMKERSLQSTGRSGYTQDAWVLQGYLHTYNPEYINKLTQAINNYIDTYGANYFESGVSLRQEMGLFLPFLYDLYKTTGDERYKDAVIRLADWAMTTGYVPAENNFWHYYGSQMLKYWNSKMQFLPGFGFAYLASGDSKYLDFVEPFFVERLGESDSATDEWAKGSQAFIKTIHLQGILSKFYNVSQDTTLPSIPQNLNANPVSESQINLSWDASTDSESGISYYKIYRDGSYIAQSVTTSYSDTGLTENTTYTYQVSAVNGAGLESDKSASAQATTTSQSSGTVYNANPSNYRDFLSLLMPGDTLLLEAGNYYELLRITDLNGELGNPIVIMGPESGQRAVFLGQYYKNIVEIRNSSYLEIKNLELDCLSLDCNGISSKTANHDITLENLYIHNFDYDQQAVGIQANDAPSWNWIIRNNIIVQGGTGMYLGSADGTNPFVNSIIENNIIYDTIGYNTEIKHQNPRPDIPDMPTGKSSTIIRNNVFSKGSNSSIGDNARPNLLVGHFPTSGTGNDDEYHIYGNFFYQNPTDESLFQGEGNVALYNNVFVNNIGTGYPAVSIQPQNDVPKMIRVFYNTIVSNIGGIKVSGGDPAYEQKVIGNAVFAGSTAISASDQIDNIVDTYSNAVNYLNNPFGQVGVDLDLYPKPGMLKGSSIDTSSFNTFTDWNKDFNGDINDGTFRGAYAGEGNNPGWQLKLERRLIVDSTTARLQIYNTNYLQYNGEQIALFGMGNFWTVSDPGVDYQDMINAYKSDGSNFMRMSLFGHTVAKRAGLDPVNVIHPFLRSSTSGANDGGNKFDLTQFNPVYFQRLENISKFAQQNDVFIMYVIWDEIPLESDTARWIYNPFNPTNNINNLGLPSGDAVPEFYNLNNAELLSIQEAFLNKVLDTVAQYGNVFFTISNEYTGSTPWHKYWVDLINNYETTSGYNPILTNELEWSDFSPDYTDFISLETSQIGGPDNWRSNRPVVNHKTGPKFERGSSGRRDARRAWWSVFVNGGHTSDDSHDGDDPPDQHNSPNTLLAREQISYFRNFIETLSYNEMVPAFIAKSGLISTGEGRVKLGEEYVIYLKNGGSVDVDLSDASGTLDVKWYNPREGTYSNQGTVQGGSTQSFTAPDSNDWILHLTKSTISDSTPPTTPQNFNANPVSESQIDLTWTASTDPESGISNYRIYRDDSYIAQSTTTSYSDTGLNEGTAYTYQVSAVNGAGLESDKSTSVQATTLADTTPPTIVSVTASLNSLEILFSEPIEQASAEDISNYAIDNGITVSAASLAADLKTVTLTTSSHTEGITYTLTVNNIKDRATPPNTIEPNTQKTYTYVAQLVISNLNVTSGQSYEVVYNGLQNGALVYIDRDYTFTSIPSSLQGSTYIKTSNYDKDSTGDSFLSFDVNQDVIVYIGHDDKILSKPSWMASFTDTGSDIVTTYNTFSIFEKNFTAGKITLGGNEGGSKPMYTVVINPKSGITDTTPPAPPIGLRVQ